MNDPDRSNEKNQVDFVNNNHADSDDEIGKKIVVGRKEVHYEDGRNVISVIINAISVRIKMPRGTVKTLLAILAAGI